jgi:hypothetical protein
MAAVAAADEYEERRRTQQYALDTAAYKKACSTENEKENEQNDDDFTKLLNQQECHMISGLKDERVKKLSQNKATLERLKECRLLRIKHHAKYFSKPDKSHIKRINIIANSIKNCDALLFINDRLHKSTFNNNTTSFPSDTKIEREIGYTRWDNEYGKKKRLTKHQRRTKRKRITKRKH